MNAGFIVIDKPSGVTSFSTVSLVRRLTGVRRVGHAGTLDPLASGVLPVAFGPATRLIEYLDGASKTYLASVRLGVATDTYDADGRTVAEGDTSGIDAARVDAALDAFRGEIVQAPPAYSAIKLAGQPLYKYARQGVTVAPEPRRVRVNRITMLGFDGLDAEIEVECGKGTYIRSIAHDLGEALGCGAHLAALARTGSGGFTLADASPPDVLTALAAAGRLDEAVLAPDRAVEWQAAALFDGAHVGDVLAGRDVRIDASYALDLCRAYSVGGDFLGVLRRGDEGSWHPEKVLAAADRP